MFQDISRYFKMMVVFQNTKWSTSMMVGQRAGWVYMFNIAQGCSSFETLSFAGGFAPSHTKEGVRTGPNQFFFGQIGD